jgi:hypothetical protein
MIPPWDAAYPEGFAALPDLSLGRTAAVAGTLYSKVVPRSVLDHREQRVRRIWVVEARPFKSPAAYIIPAFHLAHEWRLPDHVRVWLYVRGRAHTRGP